MFQSWLSSLFIIFYRFDDLKDKIRKVLKGRVPLDKDVKKEITQALRLGKSFIFFLFFLCLLIVVSTYLLNLGWEPNSIRKCIRGELFNLL